MSFPIKLLNNKKALRVNKVKDEKVLKIKRECDQYYDWYRSTGSQVFKDMLTVKKKRLRQALKEARCKKTEDIILTSENKTRAMWNMINSQCNRKMTSQAEGSNLNAAQLNTFFTEKVQEIIKVIGTSNIATEHKYYLRNTAKPESTFSFKLVKVQDVTNILRKMKNSFSNDVYSLSSAMLKCDSVKLPELITRVVNTCILDAQFPKALKFVKVTPIHKKGSLSSSDNFRPVSIVPILSKVIEATLNNQIVKYFEENKIFTDSQFGFRSGLGTVKSA
ncbi:uncharacterized protein LOC126092740 [Schistocerca cancellata]|uniref:uncharacterized protein LOC126092740 n=1 Tax=Schistocerca cancellata TaxID=274614 RepID=UPI002118C38C|nr:uncharacterized protein LOC126092740 [Schistocerca cancellata]